MFYPDAFLGDGGGCCNNPPDAGHLPDAGCHNDAGFYPDAAYLPDAKH